MRFIKLIILFMVFVGGGLIIVFGEFDDSPGAQGLGLIISLTSLWAIYKQYRQS